MHDVKVVRRICGDNMTLEKIKEIHKTFKDMPWIVWKKGEINIPFKCKNIEVCEYWYDDENNPDFNTWIDVEGIGYGWMWCSNKIRRKFKFLQRRAIKKFAKAILKEIDDDTDIAAFYYKNIFVYGFIPKDNPDVFIQIRLSNEELYF